MEIEFYSMQVYPEPSKDDKNYSVMVLVYDEDLSDNDLAFYNFKDKQWFVMGGFSMKLKCWCNIPKPKKEDVFNYKTEKHAGYR